MSDINALITTEEITSLYVGDIKKANLLSSAIMNIVEGLMPELQHDMQTQTIWRTETEIRCSVLNGKDFPDQAAKYHQSKLEQLVFFQNLLQLSFDYKKKQQEMFIIEADIEEIDFKLDDLSLKPFQIKKLTAEKAIREVDKQELVYGLENMQIQGRERARELEIWSKIKAELNDGSFDVDSKDQNQLVSMTRRYIQEAFNAAMTNGAGGDISGFNNILAQFHSLVTECISRGKIEEVLSYFEGQPVEQWVRELFKIA